MSIQQRQNFNGERMVNRAYNNIDSAINRQRRITKQKHPAIVLEDSFWADIQNALTRRVGKYRQLLAAGGYTDAARELRTLQDLAIRMAVERFRERTLDDPHSIHDDAVWEEFKREIRECMAECSV